MKILTVLAHPDPGSFNHAIASICKETLANAGHDVIFHDLYAEKFDPLLPKEEIPSDIELPETVQKHCDDLLSADAIIIVHPNWWSQPPAILNGWVSRVIRSGLAYKFEEGPDGNATLKCLLKIRAALVLTTSNTPNDVEKAAGDPLEIIWNGGIFGFVGIRNFRRINFSPVVFSTPEQRAIWLDEASKAAAALICSE